MRTHEFRVGVMSEPIWRDVFLNGFVLGVMGSEVEMSLNPSITSCVQGLCDHLAH
jgi:hypothetical protein